MDSAASYMSGGKSGDTKEMAANRFAAALLMPRRFIENALGEGLNAEQLAKRFQVSLVAILIGSIALGWFQRVKGAPLLAATDPEESLDVLERGAALNLFNPTIVHRNEYAVWLLRIVCLRIIAVNIFFVLIGLKILHNSNAIFKTFTISIFADVVALPLIITRSLFPSRESLAGQFFESIVKKKQSSE